MLDSVAQCAFIGGLFASASQVPTCYHIVALELFSTPNTAPSVVVGFQLLPGSSITDLKAQLVACRVRAVGDFRNYCPVLWIVCGLAGC
jgi:hypothetical protein